MACVYYIIPVIFLTLGLFRKYQQYKWNYCKNNVKLNGKTVLITGGNSGIGLEAAKELAKRGAKVLLACRSYEKAKQTIEEIEKSLGGTYNLIPVQLDLSSLKSVKSCVDQLNKTESKIDILINNAGVAYPKNEIKYTEDNFEIHFGVNHLAHFFLTQLLLPNLKAAAPSRIVIVSSMLHQKGNIYLNDLNMENRANKTACYNNSKLANAYFCRELAERVKSDGIDVYSLCPGWVNTGLFRNYIFKWYQYFLVIPAAFLFMRSTKQGAQTIIYCATEPNLQTGQFYRNCNIFQSSFPFDSNVSKELWNASERMIESKIKIH